MQAVNPSSPRLRRGMAEARLRHAPTAAYIAAAVNLAAGLVMLFALRHGIPAGESDRHWSPQRPVYTGSTGR